MNTAYTIPWLNPQHPQMFDRSSMASEYQVEDPKVVMRLVNNLKYLFNIQEGDYITFVLGYGACRSNDESLKYWVMDQLTQHPVGHDEVLGYLVDALKEQLMMEVCS
jgi:hypothetical protein